MCDTVSPFLKFDANMQKMMHFWMFLKFFELPGAKKTSKKPFRLVKYEVLVGENVKSFGLAAF